MNATVQALDSQTLSAAAEALAPVVRQAKDAALGLRDWDLGSKDKAGATYELSRYRLGPGACDAEVQAVLDALDPMAQTVGGWTSSVQLVPNLDAAQLSVGLSAWRRREEEERAVEKLAERLAELMRANPSLVILAMNGDGPTLRLAGNAILDNSTREAVLVWGWITLASVHRRVK